MSDPEGGPDVSVRVAWPADASGIAAVQLRAWEQRYGDLLPRLLAERGLDASSHAAAWQESLKHPPLAENRALVALAHDHVVGFALTGPATDPDADPASEGEVVEFTIDPEWTGKGHGSRLVQAVVETLQADGFSRAVCWLDSTDDQLREFLVGAGWGADGASRSLADEGGAGEVKQVRLHTDLGDASPADAV
ncbi:GNAT family N-acetyltransferase [Nocardioides panacisoli]|uniref:GNAT family N-acetyltransferase n=1 Tax=Nocardioides panacisoli TaxID=627624 RepID=UPI001C6361AC|nr:GNAT family N-acetyltransferase [Nocardioides panacisoli]QYJ05540.1 GNAT family N-acetyltransferase [Nocardioides panacisoli]